MRTTHPNRRRMANRRRDPLRMRAFAALLAFAALALIGAPQAIGAPSDISSGDADWGIKQSFRNYVENSPPAGTIAVSGGATRNEDGTFGFQPGSGTYDPETGAVDAKFAGTATFSKHGGALSFELSNPRIAYEGTSGTIYADVTSSGTEYPGVDFATLDLAGITPADDGSKLTVAGVPATLTENGAQAFAGFYAAGTELDPVTFSVAYEAPPQGPAGTIAAGAAGQTVGKDREVVLGKARCASGRCDLSTPDEVTAEIRGGRADGKRVTATIRAPRSVQAGEPATIVAKLKRGSARKLAKGGSARIRARIALTGTGSPVAERIWVKVKAGG